jgi:hypothetical protein
MTNIILAIDLGKYKSVDWVLDQNTGEFRFATLDTSRDRRRRAPQESKIAALETTTPAGSATASASKAVRGA